MLIGWWPAMKTSAAQHDGIYHQDWHIEDDPAAATAFRRAAAALPLASP
jgi:hypothetical protein